MLVTKNVRYLMNYTTVLKGQGWLRANVLNEVFLVVEPNPDPNYSARILQRFKSLPLQTLPLDCSNAALHQADLLRAMRHDEFLLQAIASDPGV